MPHIGIDLLLPGIDHKLRAEDEKVLPNKAWVWTGITENLFDQALMMVSIFDHRSHLI